MTKEITMQRELKHTVFKNDRKAPRFGKAEFVHHVVSRDLFKKWKSENPKYSHFSYRVFLNHWDMITQEIYNQIVTNPDGVRLPYHNGDLVLKYVLGNNKVVNNKASSELGKEVKFLNWHSDKKTARVCWIIDFARKRNKWLKIFAGKIDRKLNKEVFKALQTHPEIFKTSRITAANAVIFDKKKKNG